MSDKQQSNQSQTSNESKTKYSTPPNDGRWYIKNDDGTYTPAKNPLT